VGSKKCSDYDVGREKCLVIEVNIKLLQGFVWFRNV